MERVEGHELHSVIPDSLIGTVIADESGKEFRVNGFLDENTLSLEPNTSDGDFPWFPASFVKP